jgi:hypothetical protein
MAGSSGTSLAQKLGIQEGHRVTLIGAHGPSPRGSRTSLALDAVPITVDVGNVHPAVSSSLEDTDAMELVEDRLAIGPKRIVRPGRPGEELRDIGAGHEHVLTSEVLQPLHDWVFLT